jgi:hypothetical protein
MPPKKGDQPKKKKATVEDKSFGMKNVRHALDLKKSESARDIPQHVLTLNIEKRWCRQEADPTAASTSRKQQEPRREEEGRRKGET